MSHADGRAWIAYNGEIFNYLELRRELESTHQFLTATDTEVLTTALDTWGAAALDRLLGMFAFATWDEASRTLFAVRDRFGVKPLYYHLRPDGTLFVASEIKALHAAGIVPDPDPEAWATYLATGFHDWGSQTFWRGVAALPPGHSLTWREGAVQIRQWYDFGKHAGAIDRRAEAEVIEEYLALMRDAVRIRFRSDVPVGINLSGGLDSSVVLGAVHDLFGRDDKTTAFTFITGDPEYDELPWVRDMLAATRHRHVVSVLTPAQIPDLAVSVQRVMDEPFGGVPTLAYAKLFEDARTQGFVVLLDGQGVDEQWAGYDYYRSATPSDAVPLQGNADSPVRPACLTPEFRRLAAPPVCESPFDDELQNRQYHDIHYRKLPRALRYNDRGSMRSSTELRSPFMDHRLMELAFRQPPSSKIRDGVSKWMLREIAKRFIPPSQVRTAVKRPIQTPQREWLRGPLRNWAGDLIEEAVREHDGIWLNGGAVRSAWAAFLRGESDNSFFVWQWISVALLRELALNPVTRETA